MKPEDTSQARAIQRESEPDVRIAVTTDSLVYRFIFVALAGGLVLIIMGATGSVSQFWVGHAAQFWIVAYVLVLVGAADLFGGRAQNRWLHGSSIAVASTAGLEAPIRERNAFMEHGGAFELRSPLFRRRLRGLAGPNRLQWSSILLMRIMPSYKKPFRALVVFDFKGPFSDLGGLRTLFMGVRLWTTPSQIPPLVNLALKGGVHVHVLPKLLNDSKRALQQCSVFPSSDMGLTGTCLSNLSEADIVKLFLEA